MSKKLKTYVLRVSEVFPTTHPRKKAPTNFRKAIKAELECNKDCLLDCSECDVIDWKNWELLRKRHTLRTNYDYWKHIIDEVNAGNAVLSVRYWQGKPFAKGSKQIEFLSLGKGEVGIQKFRYVEYIDEDEIERFVLQVDNISKPYLYFEELATNDGLSYQDFKDWFGKSLFSSEPKAIIHFTNFRY